MEARAFKWCCLGLAVIAVLGLGWMVNDVRKELKQTTATVNHNLPTILDNVKAGTTTMSQLAKDIQALRKLAGVAKVPRDKSLVVYAESVLTHLEGVDGQIGLTQKLLGSGLKNLRPVREWVRAARKEAVWLSVRSNSKRDLLKRLCQNKFGSAWMLARPGAAPVELEAYLLQHHPESATLGK